MSTPERLRARIQEIARQDGRYKPAAFFFVSETIGRTVAWIKDGSLVPTEDAEARGADKDMFHVSGRELLEGMRRLAREKWGCMARHVLEAWGVRRTEDIGTIVFLMVDDPELQWKKRDCDTEEAFADGYDFRAEFDEWSGGTAGDK